MPISMCVSKFKDRLYVFYSFRGSHITDIKKGGFFRKTLIISAIIALSLFFVKPGISAAHIKTPIFPMVFPVAGQARYTDTFGAPRSGGRTHKGADIFGYKHQPLLAAVPGTITYIGSGERSGNMLSLRDDNGNSYWYLHINNDSLNSDDGKGGLYRAFAPGIEEGTKVLAGQVIAYLGDSGNAENTSPHLHFEIHPKNKDAICPNNSLNAARRESKTRQTFNYPKILKPYPIPKLFSPDGNGYLDYTYFHYKLGRDGYVTLRILNYKEEVARVVSNKLSYRLKDYFIYWNGKGKNGGVLPDGNYMYEIIATNGLTRSRMGVISIKRGLSP